MTPHRFDNGGQPVQRIGVFRALVLGDLLCAVPALSALRHAYPDAEITLIGLKSAQALVQRLSCVDRFIAFPGYPGLPEVTPDLAALPEFFTRMQAEQFDLLVQLHGSGSVVNGIVAACGPRHSAGFVETAGSGTWSVEPANYAAWPQSGHEIERLLAVTDHLGIERQGLDLEFPVTAADRDELADIWPDAYGVAPYVCVHAGAQLRSRRWMPERFAAVADRLAANGYTVVLTGTAGEAEVVARVEAAMTAPAVNLAGRTSLWTLGALIECAQLLVSNDTGVSHIASALRTRSVVISSGADVSRWAPLDRELHRVLWRDVACRPCGHAQCPTAHECATGVTADEVLAEIPAAMLQAPERSDEPSDVRADGETNGDRGADPERDDRGRGADIDFFPVSGPRPRHEAQMHG
ncbi:MAG: ADP-heptose--lipooligosaccharide heptosyltransferase [Rhizobacter sp.]|nr:ADP-heptose--lipooligosaccharide heptosyltransferase [Rhizobacter sp.]